jgi:TrpR-related protein YerC/YecD
MHTLPRALSTLKTEVEFKNFLRDLLTLQEIEEATKRWQVAQLLDQGLPYLTIAKQVGVSTTTVTRTALWLNHGKNGYKTALSRLKK